MVKYLFFLLIIFGLNFSKAQSPFYNIDVFEPTNGDTIVNDLLGVISGPLPPPGSPLPDISPQLLDIGVTSIRNNDNYDDKLDMEMLFRCPGFPNVPAWWCSPDDDANFHFEASDSLFRVIKNNGFKLYFRIGGEGQSALPSQHHIFHGPQDTVAENNWIRASVKVVDHYDNFEGGSNMLDYLDIWTEWPNKTFWERTDADFIHFFTKALDTLKHHYPDKKIGGPGFLVPTVFVIEGDPDNEATDLLRSLYDHNIKPDYISWHLWKMDPTLYYKAGENFRKLLDGAPPFQSVPWAGSGFFDGVEIHCGAYGLPKLSDDGTTEYSRKMKYLLFNTQKGSAVLTSQWIAMQYTNTVKAHYYRDADPKSEPDTTQGDMGWSGLFYGNTQVTYKPHAHAFRLWSMLYNEFPYRLETDFPVYASDSSKLWVLPAKNMYGAFALLISNTDSLEKHYSVSLPGVALDTSNFNILVYTVNDYQDGRTPVTKYENFFEIGIQSVQLVRIIPKSYPLEIKENNVAKIEVYPNPAHNKLTITSKNGFITKVNVYSISGVPLLSADLKHFSTTIDVSGFKKGIYVIEIITDKSKTVRKTFVVN